MRVSTGRAIQSDSRMFTDAGVGTMVTTTGSNQ
jgi:hypothetical protein